MLSLKKHANKSMCEVSTDLAQMHTLAAIPKLNHWPATFFVHVHFMTFNPKFTYKIGWCRSGKVALDLLSGYTRLVILPLCHPLWKMQFHFICCACFMVSVVEWGFSSLYMCPDSLWRPEGTRNVISHLMKDYTKLILQAPCPQWVCYNKEHFHSEDVHQCRGRIEHIHFFWRHSFTSSFFYSKTPEINICLSLWRWYVFLWCW